MRKCRKMDDVGRPRVHEPIGNLYRIQQIRIQMGISGMESMLTKSEHLPTRSGKRVGQVCAGEA